MIKDEFEAQIENGNWETVDHPISKKPIGTRFVFRTKLGFNEAKARRKARLAAKELAQIPR